MGWARTKGVARALHIFAAILALFGGLSVHARAFAHASQLPVEIERLRPVLGDAFEAYVASFCDGQHSNPSGEPDRDDAADHEDCLFCGAEYYAAIEAPRHILQALERLSFRLRFRPRSLNLDARTYQTAACPRAPPAY